MAKNAEDMNATEVRFILDENGIDFEHNGTKRSFNIADIDATAQTNHKINLDICFPSFYFCIYASMICLPCK